MPRIALVMSNRENICEIDKKVLLSKAINRCYKQNTHMQDTQIFYTKNGQKGHLKYLIYQNPKHTKHCKKSTIVHLTTKKYCLAMNSAMKTSDDISRKKKECAIHFL